MRWPRRCSQAGEVRSLLRVYQAIFDRVADNGGLTFWVNRFRYVQEQNPGLSYKDALIETIQQWLQSDEYVTRFGADRSEESFCRSYTSEPDRKWLD